MGIVGMLLLLNGGNLRDVKDIPHHTHNLQTAHEWLQNCPGTNQHKQLPLEKQAEWKKIHRNGDNTIYLLEILLHSLPRVGWASDLLLRLFTPREFIQALIQAFTDGNQLRVLLWWVGDRTKDWIDRLPTQSTT